MLMDDTAHMNENAGKYQGNGQIRSVVKTIR